MQLTANGLAKAGKLLKSSSPCALVFSMQPNRLLFQKAVAAFRKVVAVKFIILASSSGGQNNISDWIKEGPEDDTVVLQRPTVEKVLIYFFSFTSIMMLILVCTFTKIYFIAGLIKVPYPLHFTCEGQLRTTEGTNFVKFSAAKGFQVSRPLPKCPHPLVGRPLWAAFNNVFPFSAPPRIPGGRPTGYAVQILDTFAQKIGIDRTWVFGTMLTLVSR